MYNRIPVSAGLSPKDKIKRSLGAMDFLASFFPSLWNLFYLCLYPAVPVGGIWSSIDLSVS